jgi:hypothetical protein
LGAVDCAAGDRADIDVRYLSFLVHGRHRRLEEIRPDAAV